MMVPATVGPQARTDSMAAAVVQCSRMIRSLGKRLWRSMRVGRKDFSAVRTVVAFCWATSCSVGGAGGTSPCKFRIRSCSSIALNTG